MAQAVRVHYVNVGTFRVNPDTLAVIDRNDPKQRIKDQLRFDIEHRIIPATDVPNSASQPRIRDYLIAEAAAGYVVRHMDQTEIVTYHQGDMNAATVA